MRVGLPSLVFLMLFCTVAAAQTINGESTYEDNVIHSPPSTAPATRDGERPEAGLTQGAPSQSPRDDQNR